MNSQMDYINSEELRLLVASIYQFDQLRESFKVFEEKYKNSFNFEMPFSIQERAIKINKRQASKNPQDNLKTTDDRAQCFVFGQFKVFTWVLAVYCFQKNTNLQQLDYQDYRAIQGIFHKKSLLFVQYEIFCLIYEKKKYSLQWSQQEIDIFTQIVIAKEKQSEWRLISFQLFQASEGKFYRPFQQCRQKWCNHLDPNVRRGEWTQEEDIALLLAVDCFGCKWADISRDLGGVRTEHMIKNRYKSIINKWKKKYHKASPKKIVGHILKQMKRKLKNEDYSQIASEELSYCSKESKIKKEKETSCNLDFKESNERLSSNEIHQKDEGCQVEEFSLKLLPEIEHQKVEVSEPEKEKENMVMENQDEMEDESEEFDLGLGGNFNMFDYGQNRQQNEQEQQEECYRRNQMLAEHPEYYKDLQKDQKPTSDGTEEDEQEVPATTKVAEKMFDLFEGSLENSIGYHERIQYDKQNKGELLEVAAFDFNYELVIYGDELKEISDIDKSRYSQSSNELWDW